MSKRLSLQPLPRRLSAESAPAPASAGKSDRAAPVERGAARPGKPVSPSQHKKAVIEPRRIALKYASQTLVLEYKEKETGKLRHRSFRIDVDRFETAAQCERKLWGRLSKAVVPGSLQASQVGKLVAQLFQHEMQQNPDADELEQATEQFMAAQVEQPTPTKIVKPMLGHKLLADVKSNQLEETRPEKKIGSPVIRSDKENDPNLGVAAESDSEQGAPISSTSATVKESEADSRSASAWGGRGDESPATVTEQNDGTSEPLPDPVRSTSNSLLGDMPKLPGTLAGMPKLPGTLGGGATAGRRAGLQPLVSNGGSGGSGGFGSLTASLGLPSDEDDEDDYKPPALEAALKSADTEGLSAPKEVSPVVATPVSVASSDGSGAGRFLSVGVKSPVAGVDAKPSEGRSAPSDSFDLDEEVVEDEDIPDYADDFEDEFGDEDDNDLSLPLPGSNVKDKVGDEKKAEDPDAEDRPEETAGERQERLRLRGDDVDLQKVEETELDKYKRLMEQEFEKNAIKPGDANWQHDVQVDFGEAEEDCGWDEEDEEADEEEDAF